MRFDFPPAVGDQSRREHVIFDLLACMRLHSVRTERRALCATLVEKNIIVIPSLRGELADDEARAWRNRIARPAEDWKNRRPILVRRWQNDHLQVQNAPRSGRLRNIECAALRVCASDCAKREMKGDRKKRVDHQRNFSSSPSASTTTLPPFCKLPNRIASTSGSLIFC